jgi:hypothetical protein
VRVRIIAREAVHEAIHVLGLPDLLQADHVRSEAGQIPLDDVQALREVGCEPDPEGGVEADERQLADGLDHVRLVTAAMHQRQRRRTNPEQRTTVHA